MEECILEIIRKIVKEKEEKHISPTDALDIDLFKVLNSDCRKALNKLYLDGKISVSSSLNNKIIKINE